MDVINEVCKDLQKRAKLGEKKYGERLRPFNGRNGLQDAYEEALDLANYLKQCLMEQEMESKIEKIRKTKVKEKKIEPAFPF